MAVIVLRSERLLNPGDQAFSVTLFQGMLRDPEDAPASLAQLSVHLTIPFAVAGDLCLPEFPVSLRSAIALGTSMPEASIHKDHQALLAKREVGLARKLEMPPPPFDPLLLEDSKQHPLSPFVPLPLDQGHHLGSFLRGEDVGHF